MASRRRAGIARRWRLWGTAGRGCSGTRAGGKDFLILDPSCTLSILVRWDRRTNVQVLMSGADHGQGHGVSCWESLVYLWSSFEDDPEARDNAKKADCDTCGKLLKIEEELRAREKTDR